MRGETEKPPQRRQIHRGQGAQGVRFHPPPLACFWQFKDREDRHASNHPHTRGGRPERARAQGTGEPASASGQAQRTPTAAIAHPRSLARRLRAIRPGGRLPGESAAGCLRALRGPAPRLGRHLGRYRRGIEPPPRRRISTQERRNGDMCRSSRCRQRAHRRQSHDGAYGMGFAEVAQELFGDRP
jgi:hypothetical protein